MSNDEFFLGGRVPSRRALPDLPTDRPEMRYWSRDELRQFLDVAATEPLFPLWRLLTSTGLRRGEALGLRWGDVNLETGRLSVRQQLVRSGATVAFGPPKTRAGQRMVSLDAVTVNALRTLAAEHRANKLRWGEAYRKDLDLVFCHANGLPYDPDVVSHQFGRQVSRANVRKIRLHDLRHTHATLALSAGIHPKVVQERLGHSSVKVTLDLYSHVVPALQEDAAERIAALVDAV